MLKAWNCVGMFILLLLNLERRKPFYCSQLRLPKIIIASRNITTTAQLKYMDWFLHYKHISRNNFCKPVQTIMYGKKYNPTVCYCSYYVNVCCRIQNCATSLKKTNLIQQRVLSLLHHRSNPVKTLLDNTKLCQFDIVVYLIFTAPIQSKHCTNVLSAQSALSQQ